MKEVNVSAMQAWTEGGKPRGSGLSILLTGLPGAGKTSIAREFSARMWAIGHHVTILDGGEFRSRFSPDLGFSRSDREANLRRAGLIAAEVLKHGGTVICSFIAPYEESRRGLCERLQQSGKFSVVYISTPLEECERRDVRALYRKARAGSLRNFTGISDIYEMPGQCDIALDTTELAVTDSTDRLIRVLAARHRIPDLWLAAGSPHTARLTDSAVQCSTRLSATVRNEERRAWLFQRLLQAIPEHRIALSALARQIGIERHTIEKAVRSITGGNFRELQRDLLFQRAKLLLQEGRSIKETAFDLGFGSPQAFDRFVKRACGETPSLLRR